MNPHIIKNPKLAETCISKTQYFEKFLANTDYVLCNVSAAEYIGLCNWTTAPEVYVYTKQECVQNHIEILSNGYLWYTTVNQTINDLLKDNTIDEQVILESLAELYFKNNYADLKIQPENQKAFDEFRPYAESYYIQA